MVSIAATPYEVECGASRQRHEKTLPHAGPRLPLNSRSYGTGSYFVTHGSAVMPDDLNGGNTLHSVIVEGARSAVKSSTVVQREKEGELPGDSVKRSHSRRLTLEHFNP